MPPAPHHPHRFLAWARRPALAVGLLGVAVAVSVAHGQPPPVDRPSGVSVTAALTKAPPEIGDVLLVSAGTVIRFDTRTRKEVPLRLPTGVRAQSVWSIDGYVVVLARLPSFPVAKLPVGDRPGEMAPAPSTAAYLVRLGRPALLLGLADRVVPAAGAPAVWLPTGGRATLVALPSGKRGVVVYLPRLARLIADTPSGLVATTGTTFPVTPSPTPGRPSATATRTATAASGVDRTATPATARAAGAQSASAGRGGSGSAAIVPPAAGSTVGPSTGPSTSTLDAGATAGDPGTPAPVPLTTLLVQTNGLTRFLAEAEALAAVGDVVLVRRPDLRLGVVSLDTIKPPRWLPPLSAVEATGPAALDADGRTFAVLARVNDHARLMVGPTAANDESDINVVALDGGIPPANPQPPAFTASGRVMAPRPDGKIVYYYAGQRSGLLLGDDVPPATAVAQA